MNRCTPQNTTRNLPHHTFLHKLECKPIAIPHHHRTARIIHPYPRLQRRDRADLTRDLRSHVHPVELRTGIQRTSMKGNGARHMYGSFVNGVGTEANAFASAEGKKKAKNPEYGMVSTDAVRLLKIVKVEDGHFNPALCPCAQESCEWEGCDGCKAAYVIPLKARVKPDHECFLPKSTSDHGIQKEGTWTENSLVENEQSKDFCAKEFFCIEAAADCGGCDWDLVGHI